MSDECALWNHLKGLADFIVDHAIADSTVHEGHTYRWYEIEYKGELERRLNATCEEFKTSGIRDWPVISNSEHDPVYEAYRIVEQLSTMFYQQKAAAHYSSTAFDLGSKDPKEIASVLRRPTAETVIGPTSEADRTPTATPSDFVDELNDTEATIIEALGTNHLTGVKLAKEAGYPYNSHFKSNVSSLVKRHLLSNAHGKGYEVTSKGKAALESYQRS
ncbi:MAG: hypothetical protein AABZ47_18490 [Planctomycetota bacterium]